MQIADEHKVVFDGLKMTTAGRQAAHKQYRSKHHRTIIAILNFSSISVLVVHSTVDPIAPVVVTVTFVAVVVFAMVVFGAKLSLLISKIPPSLSTTLK